MSETEGESREMRIKHSALFTLALTLAVVLGGLPASADPPSYGSFDPASFTDIYLTPIPATDTLTYNLSLGTHPTITISGITYNVNWVQAYFLVSQDEDTGIEATDAGVACWTWEYKAKPGAIAGWRGEAGNRINPGQGKALGFASLNIDGNEVLSGMHVGYQTGSSETTGWYSGTLLPVPEPSSMICLAVAVTALLPIARRRS